MVYFNEDKQNKRIDDLRAQEEERLTEMLSHKYNLPYIDLTLAPVDREALRVVREKDAREAGLAAFNIVDKKVDIAVLSPQKSDTLALIEKIKERGYTVDLFMVSHKSLEKVYKSYKDLSFSFKTKKGSLDISNEEIQTLLKQVHTLEDIKALIGSVSGMKKAYKISRFMEIIIAGALSLEASDIHIEPGESSVRLRYRLDGVLADILEFDQESFALLLSRIKLLSGLKLNVKGRAQDGRFSIKIGETNIEIRTSVLPGNYNESVVLRILNPKNIAVPLEELGIHPILLKILLKEIEKPNGMLLTTGPTGSGKTTTLYAFLRKVHSPEIKIITIENPVEYHLPGIVQTQTNKKEYTFHEGLRSAVRQDPDIIMVGEIRDSETARTAIDAALTGHFVFSTLHTNNAAGAYPRLIALDVNPKVISSALNVSMAQRLVRRLCGECKTSRTMNEKELKLVSKTLEGISPEYLEGVQQETISEAHGCKACGDLGYKGRVGLYEAVFTDKAIEEVLQKNPSEREIEEASRPQGIPTMAQDGIIKALQGMTTLEELGRVVDIEETIF